MIAVVPWKRSLIDVLEGPKLTAEEIIAAEIIARPIVRFRNHYIAALIATSGINVPPHERLMLHTVMLGAPENVNVSSRGTSKTTVVCVLGSSLISMLYGKKRIVTLSATGFRGGQNIFDEVERFAIGGRWDSQEDVDFVSQCLARGQSSKSVVHRAQNFWSITWASHSVNKTLPTNNEDKIRGERAQLVFIDEANTTDETLISKVVRPFLNVKGGFDTGGADAPSNMAFYTSTLDYSWRPFMATIRAAQDGVRRDVDALAAARRGDQETYKSLERTGLLGYTYTSFDYTDTIIREQVTDRAGQAWTVQYPNANELLGRPRLDFREMSRGIPFSQRGADGRMQREGVALRALTTYPIDKEGIERTLYDGSTDESIWLAEQRNVVDTAGGDVYPHGLMDRVASVGSNAIVKWGDCGAEWKAAWPEDRGVFAPIMWDCDDPCVLGVDVASGARDFAAFCVIRMGQLASGPFNPMGVRSLGQTDWSSVIWQEQHRLFSYKDIADKIRHLRSRYNLVWHHEPWKDDWEWCRGIGLDDRGGGRAVRDALVYLDRAEDEIPEGAVRIYDPLDNDPKLEGLKQSPQGALPMLDLIAANDTTNDRLVEFTLAQMKVGRFFLPKWLEESQRPDRDRKLDVAYLGARVLEHQLRKLQQSPTARARSFYMPGSAEAAENKRDAWASFIYAAKQLRSHLLRAQFISTRPPAVGGVRTAINKKRGQHGRSPGGKL